MLQLDKIEEIYMANIRQSDIYHDTTGVAIDTGNRDQVRKKISDLKAGKLIDNFVDNDTAYKEIRDAAEKFVRSNSLETEQELAKVLEKYNLHLYCYPYNETSRDKRDVARMAFSGWVNKPFEEQLSDTFRKYKNRKVEKVNSDPEKYNLDNSSAWQVFKQVPEFAEHEEKLKEGLANYGIDPNELPNLKAKDIAYILGGFSDENTRKTSAPLMKESYKAKHTKRFINENKEEFKKGMYAMLGVSNKEMELFENIAKIKKQYPNISDEEFAQKKNQLVRDAHVSKEGFKKAIKSAAYVNRLIEVMEQGRTDLSEDKNPDGTLKWEGMPVIDVHHVVNIKDASTKEGEGKGFNSINDYSNMCFIVRNPQHDAMHALENDMNGKYREDIFYNREIDKKFIYRIQPPEGVKCVFGFNNMIYDKEYLANNDLSKEEVKAKAYSSKYHIQNSNRENMESKSNNFTNNDRRAKQDAIRKSEKHKINYVEYR